MQQLQEQAFQDGQFQCISYRGFPEGDGQKHVNGHEWRAREREPLENPIVPEVRPRTRTRTFSASRKHQSWSTEESSFLRALVGVYTENGQWEAIAHEMPGRTPYACAFRWSKIKAEENRQKRARRPKAAHATSITLSESIELDQDNSEQDEGSRVVQDHASKSGRWLMAEDSALNAGVSAYLATLGLELQPPVYLSTEDSLNENEQPYPDNPMASALTDTPTLSEDQTHEISSSSDIFTDLFESLVDAACGASDGDGLAASGSSASRLDSLRTTPEKSSTQQPTPPPALSQQCNDVTPWISASYETTTGLDIVEDPAFWKPNLYLNTEQYLQLDSPTNTASNDQNPGLFPEEQPCLLVASLGLGAADLTGRIPSGNIETASPVSQRQENSSLAKEDTLADLWTIDLQSMAQTSTKTVSQEDFVPSDSSLTSLTFSPPGMTGTRSTPLDNFLTASTTSTPPILSHPYANRLPSSEMDHCRHQYSDQLYDTNNLTIPTATPTTLPPRPIGMFCPSAVRQVFDSCEAHSLAISRAMAVCPWSLITACSIPWRTGVQAQARWSEALDPRVKRGPWTQEEDEMLMAGVRENNKCWILIADGIPGRTQRQCRTRWVQITAKAERAAAAGQDQTSTP